MRRPASRLTFYESSDDEDAGRTAGVARQREAFDRRGISGLADVPADMKWFANLSNAATCLAYQTALLDFTRFTGCRPSPRCSITSSAHCASA